MGSVLKPQTKKSKQKTDYRISLRGFLLVSFSAGLFTFDADWSVRVFVRVSRHSAPLLDSLLFSLKVLWWLLLLVGFLVSIGQLITFFFLLFALLKTYLVIKKHKKEPSHPHFLNPILSSLNKFISWNLTKHAKVVLSVSSRPKYSVLLFSLRQ